MKRRLREKVTENKSTKTISSGKHYPNQKQRTHTYSHKTTIENLIKCDINHQSMNAAE